jgi:hypothetical protein
MAPLNERSDTVIGLRVLRDDLEGAGKSRGSFR